MHIIVVTVVLSIVGLIMSLAFVGIMPSFIALILSIYCLKQKKTIARARALALSVVGVIVPILMYLNSYGLSGPHLRSDGLSFVAGIIYDNYSNFGLDMEWMKENKLTRDDGSALVAADTGEEAADAVSTGDSADGEDEMYYVSNGGEENKPEEPGEEDSGDISKQDSIDASQYDFDIFEKLEEATDEYDKKPISTKVGASDDDMPSYGGLPVGTLIVAQYFREDVHNCNPVLVLQNMTGKICRYEGRFIARGEDGEELATSEVCVEVVQNEAKFVLEGRFDKKELGGRIPAMYEFSVTKRDPYEIDRTGEVVVYTKENETGDAYIERLLREVGKNCQARVVTSDNLIQVSALRSGVIRQSAREFGEEIDRVYGDIEQFLRSHNRQRMGTIGENLPSTP